MAAPSPSDDAPDLALGIPLGEVPLDGVLGVMLDGEPWLLARVAGAQGGEIVAVGGKCTHYEGPLAKGLRSGDTIRCPWHHACFSLRTGRALEAPAFDALPRRQVTVKDGKVFPADEEAEAEVAQDLPDGVADRRIVVVGAGAAGFAAVDRLRALGHTGRLAWFDSDAASPCDRPNLSKDYLAGKAEADWLALGSQAVGGASPRRATVVAVHRQAREVELEGGERIAYDALLLAPGAEPNRPSLPGFDARAVHVLRTVADSDAIIDAAGKADRVVVVGAGFIGLETAAGLRQRGSEVAVVTPDALPLVDKVGPELAGWVKALHEKQGVVFHVERQATAYADGAVSLDDGTRLQADLVVVGAGVSPRLGLAQSAGLAADGAVPVGPDMRCRGDDAVWAAGDVAAFPDAGSGESIRVEHWVAAERQGQIAAASMLGLSDRWAEPPFFWSAHFDKSFRYVGHADRWDAIEIEGDLDAGDAELRYVRAGRVVAVATVGRDMAALRAAEAMRRDFRERG